VQQAGRRPTIADVARIARVSKTTVSRVLNNKPDVDAATVHLVRTVVEGLGYVPSSSAVSLARGRAHTMGLLAPSLSAPWMLEVLRGMTEAIEDTDYSLTLYTTSQGRKSFEAVQGQLRSQVLDGLAIMQPPEAVEDLHRLYSSGVPIVVIDDRGAHRNVPSVAGTDFDGIGSAVAHLVERGRRRLAMIAGPMHIACHRDRLKAFEASLRSCGLTPDPSLLSVAADDTLDAGAAALTPLLRNPLPFDGLVVGNDSMALGAMRRLREAGFEIPRDVAVTGFDDIAAAAHAEPPLTTVYNPLYEMGGTAVRLLLEACGGEELPESTVFLPTRLVVRSST
jgi:LacI family transcriptional regulator